MYYFSMEDHHIKLILNYSSLTDPESGFDPEHILDYLRKDDEFRADECEEILACRTTTAKAKCLLDFLLEKNDQAYNLFREGLKVNYPHFTDELDNSSVTDRDRCLTLSSSRLRVGNALGNRRTLPTLSRTLIGRNDEHCTFLRWLQDGANTSQRLYIFTGPPGIGKTILMVTVCSEYQLLLPSATEGTETEWLSYFDMNSYENIEDLATDMLISLQQSPVKHTVRQLCNFLRSSNRAYILIFDNAENMLSDCLTKKYPEFLEKILQCSIRIRVVLSSRVSIKSLTIHSFEQKLKPLEEQDGIALAQSLVPSLNLENASRLCKINGYLPLAIHLTSMLLHQKNDCEELLSALEKSPTMTVELLESIEGIPASSQLTNCFQSCFSQLNHQQQQAMRAFSAFPSTFTRKAAEAVCFRGSLYQTNSLLHAHKMLCTLEDRSMLMFDEEKQKYQIHPLLRSFCSKLVTSAEKKVIEEDYCRHYIRFARDCCQLFYQKDCCRQAVQDFWSERQNIIHCLQLCLSKVSLTRFTQSFASRHGLEFLRITLPDKLIKETYLSLWSVLEPSELEEKFMVLTSLSFLVRVVEGNPTESLTYINEAGKFRVKCDKLNVEQQIFYLHTKAKTLAVLGCFEQAERLAQESFRLSMTLNEEEEAFVMKGFSMEVRAGIHRNCFIKNGSVLLAQESNREYDAVLKFLRLGLGNHIFARYIHMSQGELRERVQNFSGALESYKLALSVQNVVMEDCIDQAIVYFLIGSVEERLGDLTNAAQSLTTAFTLSCKILGSSDKTKACGEKLIDVLKKLGDLDSVETYKQKLQDTMSHGDP